MSRIADTARVQTALDQGVYSIRLNRPDKRNAIDSPMIDQLLQALEQADLDSAVRVVVLRGAGKDFCAGMDLEELLASADRAVAENREAALRFAEVFLHMRRMPKPVLAVVHGRALAGGCGLATAADFVIAQRSAQFGYPEVQRGFVPAIVLTLLKRAVGEKVAFDLAATGRVISATEAHEYGLISRVIEDAQCDDAARTLCASLAGTSASALALTKQQFYELDGLSFEEGLRLGADVNAVSRTTPDFRTAIAAFLKK